MSCTDFQELAGLLPPLLLLLKMILHLVQNSDEASSNMGAVERIYGMFLIEDKDAILELSSIKVYMAWLDFLIFIGVEDAKTWLQDYGLFLLKVGLSKDKGMQQVFPLLMQRMAKQWFDGLDDEVKTDCDALEKAFQEKYMPAA
ncbi:hypothetical protein L7F22_037308 [Adiantum nelumboides]|nr:hypothetical protein [Adiantum nelumboides]